MKLLLPAPVRAYGTPGHSGVYEHLKHAPNLPFYNHPLKNVPKLPPITPPRSEPDKGSLLKYKLPDGIGKDEAKQHPLHSSWHPHANWKQQAYGGVMVRNDGKFLLREPANHFDGYAWTWPKGKMDHEGEHPVDTAIRETKEETGYNGRIFDAVPGTFTSGTGSRANFYLMRTHGTGGDQPDAETQGMKWVSYNEAKDLINQSPNKLGRLRDLAILEYAHNRIQKHRRTDGAVQASYAGPISYLGSILIDRGNTLESYLFQLACAGESWEESLHPRDSGGKFIPSGKFHQHGVLLKHYGWNKIKDIKGPNAINPEQKSSLFTTWQHPKFGEITVDHMKHTFEHVGNNVNPETGELHPQTSMIPTGKENVNLESYLHHQVNAPMPAVLPPDKPAEKQAIPIIPAEPKFESHNILPADKADITKPVHQVHDHPRLAVTPALKPADPEYLKNGPLLTPTAPAHEFPAPAGMHNEYKHAKYGHVYKFNPQTKVYDKYKKGSNEVDSEKTFAPSKMQWMAKEGHVTPNEPKTILKPNTPTSTEGKTVAETHSVPAGMHSEYTHNDYGYTYKFNPATNKYDTYSKENEKLGDWMPHNFQNQLIKTGAVLPKDAKNLKEQTENIAKAHGFDDQYSNSQGSSMAKKMPDGSLSDESVYVKPDGSWKHVGKTGGVSNGESASTLDAHLSILKQAQPAAAPAVNKGYDRGQLKKPNPGNNLEEALNNNGFNKTASSTLKEKYQNAAGDKIEVLKKSHKWKYQPMSSLIATGSGSNLASLAMKLNKVNGNATALHNSAVKKGYTQTSLNSNPGATKYYKNSDGSATLTIKPGGLWVHHDYATGKEETGTAAKQLEDHIEGKISTKQVALDKGFKETTVNPNLIQYEHPAAGNLTVYPGGSWYHYASGSYKSGQDAESLAEHLSTQDLTPKGATVIKPAPAPPKTSSDPVDASFMFAGNASSIGGAHSKYFFTKNGDKYLFKPAESMGGAKADIVAYADEAVSKIANIIRPGRATQASVESVEIPGKGKVFGSMQKFIPMDQTATDKLGFDGTNPKNLTHADIKGLQEEQVVDWLTSNHDAHGGQFLRLKDGGVVGVDKAQAFKYFPKDKLDTTYHPNSSYGTSEPYYNTLFNAVKSGGVKVNPNDVLPAIQRAQSISDSDYRQMLSSYAKARSSDPDEQKQFLDQAVARKNNLKSDLQSFYAKVTNNPDFKFNGEGLSKSANMPSDVHETLNGYGWHKNFEGKKVDAYKQSGSTKYVTVDHASGKWAVKDTANNSVVKQGPDFNSLQTYVTGGKPVVKTGSTAIGNQIVKPAVYDPKPDKIPQDMHEALEDTGFKFVKYGNNTGNPLYKDSSGKAVYGKPDGSWEYYPMGTSGAGKEYGSQKGSGAKDLVDTVTTPFEKPAAAQTSEYGSKAHGNTNPVTGELGTPLHPELDHVEYKPINDKHPKMGTGTEAGYQIGGTPSSVVDGAEKKHLTSEERSAISAYKGSTYDSIKNFLVANKDKDLSHATGSMAEYSKHIDSAMNKGQLNKNMILFRGVKYDYAQDLVHKITPGYEFSPYNFQSTATHQSFSHDSWTGGHDNLMFRIKAPKGMNAVAIEKAQGYGDGADGEHEILLPRDIKYRVTKVYHSGGKIYADLDVIGGKGVKLNAAAMKNMDPASIEYYQFMMRGARNGEELAMAMGRATNPDGTDGTPERWKQVRQEVEARAARVIAEEKANSGLKGLLQERSALLNKTNGKA